MLNGRSVQFVVKCLNRNVRLSLLLLLGGAFPSIPCWVVPHSHPPIILVVLPFCSPFVEVVLAPNGSCS